MVPCFDCTTPDTGLANVGGREGRANVKMMDREEKVGIRREKEGKGGGALFIWTA